MFGSQNKTRVPRVLTDAARRKILVDKDPSLRTIQELQESISRRQGLVAASQSQLNVRLEQLRELKQHHTLVYGKDESDDGNLVKATPTPQSAASLQEIQRFELEVTGEEQLLAVEKARLAEDQLALNELLAVQSQTARDEPGHTAAASNSNTPNKRKETSGSLAPAAAAATVASPDDTMSPKRIKVETFSGAAPTVTPSPVTATAPSPVTATAPSSVTATAPSSVTVAATPNLVTATAPSPVTVAATPSPVAATPSPVAATPSPVAATPSPVTAIAAPTVIPRPTSFAAAAAAGVRSDTTVAARGAYQNSLHSSPYRAQARAVAEASVAAASVAATTPAVLATAVDAPTEAPGLAKLLVYAQSNLDSVPSYKGVSSLEKLLKERPIPLSGQVIREDRLAAAATDAAARARVRKAKTTAADVRDKGLAFANTVGLSLVGAHLDRPPAFPNITKNDQQWLQTHQIKAYAKLTKLLNSLGDNEVAKYRLKAYFRAAEIDWSSYALGPSVLWDQYKSNHENKVSNMSRNFGVFSEQPNATEITETKTEDTQVEDTILHMWMPPTNKQYWRIKYIDRIVAIDQTKSFQSLFEDLAKKKKPQINQPILPRPQPAVNFASLANLPPLTPAARSKVNTHKFDQPAASQRPAAAAAASQRPAAAAAASQRPAPEAPEAAAAAAEAAARRAIRAEATMNRVAVASQAAASSAIIKKVMAKVIDSKTGAAAAASSESMSDN